MWCVSKDAQALLIYDLGALTLLEADGSLRSCPLPGSDIQAVLREEDVLVRFTDTEDGCKMCIRDRSGTFLTASGRSGRGSAGTMLPGTTIWPMP